MQFSRINKPTRRALLAQLLAGTIYKPASAQGQSRYELPAGERTGSIRRIMVLTHSHLDIGFTRPPDEVARDYKDNIDRAIRLVRDNADFRWVIESAWMLGEWLRRTNDERQIAELGRLLRDGRIELGAAFANMHSGLMDAEEMNRLVYLGESFRRRFGIAAEVAYQNDVPGFSWAYPRVFAGSGVKYLVTGLNLFIGGGNNLGVRNTPFYWLGPDQSRVLTWFTYDSYVEGHRWKLTGSAPFEELEKTVPRRLAWLEHNGYRYDTYLLMASAGDNADPMVSWRMLLRMREWNRRHPELPMTLCTARDFFEYIRSKYGDRFEEASGEASGHWETVKLGAPEVAARMRETAALLPAAEALATVASLMSRAEFPRYDLADAWQQLLVFHEHTAGAGAGWPGYFSRAETDWSNVAHYAAAMSGYSNTTQLLRKAVAHLAGASPILDPAQHPDGSEARVLVYNGLSRARGGPAVVSGLPRSLDEGPLEIVNAAGEALPCEDVPGTHRQVLFYAPPTPSLGYRVYRLRKASAQMPPAGDFPFDLKWDERGWITSLRENSSGIEMIDAHPAIPFGGLLVAREREDYRLEPGSLSNATSSAGSASRRIELTRRNTPLRRTVVTFYKAADFVDIAFDVDLSLLPNPSLRYGIALPVAGSGQVWIDGAGFAWRLPQDLLPGGGAAQYSVLHFAHFGGNGQRGVTVANRDAFLMRADRVFLVASEGLMTKTRDEGTERLFRTEPRGNPVQTFRFRLALQDEDPAHWKHLGLELNLPLESFIIPETSLSPEGSFVSVSHPSVRLSAFKPAESQPGRYVLRLQEIGGKSARGVRVTTPLRVTEAVLANTVESLQGTAVDLERIDLKPWQTLTLLVRFENKR